MEAGSQEAARERDGPRGLNIANSFCERTMRLSDEGRVGDGVMDITTSFGCEGTVFRVRRNSCYTQRVSAGLSIAFCLWLSDSLCAKASLTFDENLSDHVREPLEIF